MISASCGFENHWIRPIHLSDRRNNAYDRICTFERWNKYWTVLLKVGNIFFLYCNFDSVSNTQFEIKWQWVVLWRHACAVLI